MSHIGRLPDYQPFDGTPVPPPVAGRVDRRTQHLVWLTAGVWLALLGGLAALSVPAGGAVLAQALATGP